MYKTVYTGHLKGKRVLLETPTGFAVFVVKDFAFKQDKNIWVHFSDPECAIQALSALGFKKVDNKSAARNGEAGPGNDLKQLIEEFCSDAETLIVEDEKLKASIEKMTRIRCRCDGYDVDEVIWGIKKCFACIYTRRRAQYNTGILSSHEQGIARVLTILRSQYPARKG